MADDCDLSEQKEALIVECAVRQVSINAAKIPKGEPGVCRCCGEESQRLVGGACAPCRDKRHLP